MIGREYESLETRRPLLTVPLKRLLLAVVVTTLPAALHAAVPAPDPDDGAIKLPAGLPGRGGGRRPRARCASWRWPRTATST